METFDVVRHETKSAWAWLDNLVLDVAHEQANWQPQGSANSIAATYAHAVIAADVDINRYFLLRQPLICTERWNTRVGLDDLFPDHFRSSGDVKWDELHAYGNEIERFMGQLVDSLTMADLERTAAMGATDENGKPVSLGTWKGIDFVSLHGWSHIRMHGGEIACLKGLLGGEGYTSFSGRDRYP